MDHDKATLQVEIQLQLFTSVILKHITCYEF